MVEHIRELMGQPEGGPAAATAAPRRPAAAAPAAPAPPAVTSRLSDAAAHAPRPEAHTGAGVGAGGSMRREAAPAAEPPARSSRGRALARRSAATRPRLVPRRLGSHVAAKRPGCIRSDDGDARAPTGFFGPGSSPVSTRRLFRNAADRRSPFRPHDAPRRRPPAGGAHTTRAEPAT